MKGGGMRSGHAWLWSAVLAASLFVALPCGGRAEVGDPTVRTDHPQYAGEGAFQTVEDCVRFAASGKESPQDRAIALYLWLLTHQFHLASPQEWSAPGATPDTQRQQDDLIVQDANRARFSYGYGLCGTVHAWNEVYWRALGMPSRRRAFPGHVNSEVFYDQGWRAFDTDMAGLLFREDGRVAGYEDIAANPQLATACKPPLPCYPYAWPGDFQTMKAGWEEVARGGPWYAMYNAGYAAIPGVVHLRAGETFTRWFDRDHWGGPSQRRFWHHQPGGPFRDWTFVNRGEPEHHGAESNSRGNASYGNGEFVYRPDLTHTSYQEGVASQSTNVGRQMQAPHLYSRDGQAASVTFSHFSPYVICGDPADDANPMSSPATEGMVVSGESRGTIALEASQDGGQTWQSLGEASGPFRRDLTDIFKGRYGWLLRFGWNGDAGLNRLAFQTTTQVSQTIYPRLKPGGCEVTYRAGSRRVTALRPNWGLPEAQLAGVELKELRSPNVAYLGRSKQSRLAFQVKGNKPGEIVFRIASPRPLLEISAAARYSVRSPSPPGCDFHLDASTDGGKTWRTFAQSDVPTDNEFSSGWVYGRTDVSSAKSAEALVRVHLYGGGYPTGLIDAEFFGLLPTAPPQALELAYGWKENGQSRTHVEKIPAGAAEHKFHVGTAAEIVDEFIRLKAP
jgi:hypothetical protein